MGTWSTQLYGNDTTSDVRDMYIECLRRTENDEDAYKMICDECYELIGTDEEALFWFALADTQWKYGRLMPSVKNNAINFISEFRNKIPEYMNEKQVTSWNGVLERLFLQLTSPMPSRKKIAPKKLFNRNPWNVGDIYAYRFHSQKSQDFDLYEKYIVFQKIGDALSFDDLTFSVVQILNKVYSSCPALKDVDGVDILPLVYPPNVEGAPNSIEEYIPSFDWFTKAIMILDKPSSYPKKHLIYIGNISLPHRMFRGNECENIFWESTGMEEWIIEYYNEWRKQNPNI